LLSTNLCAQEPDSDDKLDSRLPERVQVTIIDTTIVRLVQRNPFTDMADPPLIDYLGIYAKERPWNLPDILTPQRVIISTPPSVKDSLVIIKAYPGLPQSLSYQILLASDFEEARGQLYINRHHWGDKRTKGRGKYNIDNFYGSLGYHYKDKANFNLNAGYDAKNLNWLEKDDTGEIKNIPRDVNLFHSDVIWQHKLRPETQSQVNFDLASLRVNDADNNELNSTTNLKLNLNITTTKLSLNPTEFGTTIEYFNANDKLNENGKTNESYWANTYRFYAANKFTNMEPFTFSVGGELVVFRERVADAEKPIGHRDINPIQFNPTLVTTTKFSDDVSFQLSFERTVLRKPIGDMYFASDYVTLNPLLRFEKHRRGVVSLKYRPDRRADIEVAAVANVINGFVYLKPNMGELSRNEVPQDDSRRVSSESRSGFSWQPDNMNANLFDFKFGGDFTPIEGLKLKVHFTHEIQKPQSGEHIPYRPSDRLTLGISYLMANELQLDFEGELYGKRYIDKAKEDSLPAYFLWKPKVSRTFGKYTTAFISAQFSSRQYELLKGYELPRYVTDFGVSVKF